MSDLKIKKIDPSQIDYSPKEGEVVQNLAGEFLAWHNGIWTKLNMDNSGININLYDINKQIIAQMPELVNLENKKYIIHNLHAKYNNDYYMLYGKSISYFTIFKINDAAYFADDVIDCLKHVGMIKAIDLTENNDAIEIWTDGEDGPTCLYLFPYDQGVVCVGE